MFRDMGIPVLGLANAQKIEVVATGLSCERGVPLAIDAPVVPLLYAKGHPHPGTDRQLGI